MGSYQVNLNPSRPLAEIFRDIPQRVRPEVREGFSILARLSSERYHQLLTTVTDSIAGRASVRPNEATANLGIRPEQIAPLVSATSFIVVTLALGQSDPAAVADAAVAAGLLVETDRRAILPFAELVVAQRSGIARILTQSRVSSAVLPILTDFDITVDVRLSFEEANLQMAVPVAIVHLDTDAYSQEIFFQVNKRQLERLIADLNTALKDMQAAERWIGTRPSQA